MPRQPRQKDAAAQTPRAATRRGSEAAAVARLRRICMALPEANERVSHGEPTWFAGKGRSFATLDNHHHGAEHLSVWLPQPIGAQEALIAAEPRRFFRPPYVGPSGWVGVVHDDRPDWGLVAQLVRDAYVHVATRKLLAQLQPSRSGAREARGEGRESAKRAGRAEAAVKRSQRTRRVAPL
jgi:hypothetical protein